MDHAEHTDQPSHQNHHAHASSTWGDAAQATLHCLTGCAIGEVLGMVLATAFSLNNVVSIVLSIVLAFVFGYGLTMHGVLRAGVDLRTAVKVALAADSVSIAVMELLDNFVMVAVPGALAATLADWLFWASLAFSLVVAFVFTTPVNKWMLARGRGHAVVHQYHH
jgi:formate/nitrite transporter FocA (FNT family)